MFEGFVPDDERFAWLSNHSSGWQFGEQGILVALVDAIDPTGQCVEIGAGDGEGLPLTIDPFYNRGNDCVLFEADLVSLGRLIVKYPMATHRGRFGRRPHGMGKKFKIAVCVIDVDGIDSEIASDIMLLQKPKVVMVEHYDKAAPVQPACTYSVLPQDQHKVPYWLLGAEMPGGFRVQDVDITINHIAQGNGYTRVGTTRVNSIFVHDSHLSKVSQ
jgi:hypothetical protein